MNILLLRIYLIVIFSHLKSKRMAKRSVHLPKLLTHKNRSIYHNLNCDITNSNQNNIIIYYNVNGMRKSTRKKKKLINE